jgi:hypothetical protein
MKCLMNSPSPMTIRVLATQADAGTVLLE